MTIFFDISKPGKDLGNFNFRMVWGTVQYPVCVYVVLHG